MKQQIEQKLSLKKRVNLARAAGLLQGVKSALKLWDDDEIDREKLIKLIDEVLELLK
jgi:hypothetical protein